MKSIKILVAAISLFSLLGVLDALAAPTTSNNSAGYVVQNTSWLHYSDYGFKSVQGTWIVPTLDCSSTPNAQAGPWVGIEYSNSITQIGTSFKCSNGNPSYKAWWMNYVFCEKPPEDCEPNFQTNINSINIHAGDRITAWVIYQGNGHFYLQIFNLNGKQFYSIGTSPPVTVTPFTKASWMMEAPLRLESSGRIVQTPLANFGTFTFVSAQYTDDTGTTYAIDGKASNTISQYNMADPNGGYACTSGLKSFYGSPQRSSFLVTYSTSQCPL